MHKSGRLRVNPRGVHEKSAGPVEQSDSRLAFKLRGIEPVFFELLQERLRPAAWDKALALAWLWALAKNTEPSPVISALGIKNMDIHLVMGDASVRRVLLKG